MKRKNRLNPYGLKTYWLDITEILPDIDDVHNLKPGQLLRNKSGETRKLYHGRKTQCKKMPKPFPLSSGISLYEDEYGWYNLSGEMVLDIN